MKTETVRLLQVKVNMHNPRTITERKMEQLVASLLVLPSMMELRPVVVDDKMTALGGNMRLQALGRIAKMSIEDIKALLSGNKDYQKKTEGERDALLSHWGDWIQNPTVTIAKAARLSEAEKKQFMITDNASFGQWDFDMLANEWDNADLKNWGVDVWQPEHPDFTPSGSSYVAPTQPPATPTIPEIDTEALPPELRGVDITPDELPKVEGADRTALERIIIVYPHERREELCGLLGIESIDKVVYNIDEFATHA